MRGKAVKRVVVTFSSIVALVAAVFVLLLLVSGFFAKPTYLEPWQKGYSDRFKDARIKLAAHGLLAANGHNMQPWIVKLDQQNPSVFYLFADSSRLTLEVDPLARQTMVSQGTFLENVRVAGEQLGYQTAIQLFPEGEYDETKLIESMDTKPVAKIAVTKTSPKPSALYDAIFLPDTNRAAYQSVSLTAEQIRSLQAINRDEGLTLRFYQGEADREKLGRYAMEGAVIETGVHRINEESAAIFRSNEKEKNQFRFGYSVEGQGTSGIMKHVLQGLVTVVPAFNNESAAAGNFIKSTQTAVDHTPEYAMIVTKDNSRVMQVKSGMLYGRLTMALHGIGFVMQPPSQVLEEYPEMQEPYRRIHSEYAPEGGTIQMFFRLGKPAQSFPQSMRRDVLDLIKR